MHNDTLQQEMIRLERMIHDLKQAKNAGTLVKTFNYSDTSADSSSPGIHKITYADGSMPIITEIYAGTSITLFTPEGNEQYYYVISQGVADVMIISTRPIVSVEFISV